MVEENDNIYEEGKPYPTHPLHPKWDKANQNCPTCGSSNTWFVPVVPEGFPDVDDICLYCEDCKSESV